MYSDPCKNLYNSRILNTIEVYGKIYLCGIKYIKNAENFKRPWHIVQKGMPLILRDKTTRLPMQSFEFAPGTLPFFDKKCTNLQTFITKFHQKLNINGWKSNGDRRHFKACFAHWPDIKNLFQLFGNFRHQSVHKAPGATWNLFIFSWRTASNFFSISSGPIPISLTVVP